MEKFTKKVAPSKINHKNAKKKLKLCYVAIRTFKRPRISSSQLGGTPRGAVPALACGRRWPAAALARGLFTAIAARIAFNEKMAARSAIPFRVNQSYLTNAAASHSTFLKRSLVYPPFKTENCTERIA